MGYKLHFDMLGRGNENVEIVVESFSEKEMDKIQKYLLSRDWEWFASLETMSGFVDVAFRTFPFTITEQKANQ